MNWTVEQEIAHKLAQMRRWLEQEGAGALRLRGVDWFAWATAGASGGSCLSAECGHAEVLVTHDAAYILTDEAEARRLRHDEVRGPWTWQVTPWMQPRLAELREHFVQHAAGGRPVLCDRPGVFERSLPVLLREERLALLPPEQLRYRAVGRLSASAASEALRAARPEWTEQELAGACARALWARGLLTMHVMAVGAERRRHYLRAPPSSTPLGDSVVLALCARRFGLCASLCRQRRFRPAQAGVDEADAALLALEAVALDACEVGNALSMVYHALDSAYAYAGQPDAVLRQRQGGITGYQAPELAAGSCTELLLKDGMALAFHPGLPGGMIEDTFMLSAERLRNLTFDPAWPSISVQGRRRPLSLELA